MMNQLAITFSSKYIPVNAASNLNKSSADDFKSMLSNTFKKNDFSSSTVQKNDDRYNGLSAAAQDKKAESRDSMREVTPSWHSVKARKAVDKDSTQNENVEDKEISKEELIMLSQAAGLKVQFLEQLINGDAVKDLNMDLDNASDMQSLVQSIQDRLDSVERLIAALSDKNSGLKINTAAFMDKLTSFLEKLEVVMQSEVNSAQIIPNDMRKAFEQKLMSLQKELEGLPSMYQKAEATINQAADSLNKLEVQQVQGTKQSGADQQNGKTEMTAEDAAQQTKDSQSDKGNSGNGSESGRQNFDFDGKVKVINLQNNQQLNQAEAVPFSDVLSVEDNSIVLEAAKKQFSMQGVNRENVVKQVLENAKVSLTDDRSEMVMQLKPDNLGKLSLQIVTERGILVAKFTAESQQVKEIIEASLPQLKDALESQGLNVKGFSVSVGNQNEQHQAYERARNGKVKGVTAHEQDGMIAAGDYGISPAVVNPYQWSDSSVDFTA